VQTKLRALLLAIIVLVTPSIVEAASRPLVPAGAYLVADQSGHLLVLNQRGKLLRRVPRFASYVQALEVAPDRRHAYVSVHVRERPPRLYKVALGTGRRIRLANAISPSLSPDRTQLAYVTVELREDVKYLTKLVVRSLRTGQARVIALPARVPLGTPPELVINWSPDGRHLALFDGTVIRVVDVATATTVDSQPEIPGATGLAPVFLNRHTLVVLTHCCIGRQRLVAVDLRSGARTAFAQVRSPVENVRRLNSGALLAVTALQRLVRLAPGRARVIATGIVAATAVPR
jgi:hypothetical protein